MTRQFFFKCVFASTFSIMFMSCDIFDVEQKKISKEMVEATESHIRISISPFDSVGSIEHFGALHTSLTFVRRDSCCEVSVTIPDTLQLPSGRKIEAFLRKRSYSNGVNESQKLLMRPADASGRRFSGRLTGIENLEYSARIPLAAGILNPYVLDLEIFPNGYSGTLGVSKFKIWLY